MGAEVSEVKKLTKKVVRMLKCFFMSVPRTSSPNVQRHSSVCSLLRFCIE